MPRPVRDLLLDLEEDVRRVHLAPARAVRERGRSRARRRVVLAAAGLTLVAGLTGTALLRSPAAPPAQPAAPPPTTSSDRCPAADLSLPDGPERVAVRVLDGVGGTIDSIGGGRDDAVVNDLRNRGFTQATAAGNLPQGASAAETVTTLRYGPRAIGKAVLLQAMLENKAGTQFDPDRADAVVDLVVGRDFRQFATTTEVNQALVEAGEPTLPPECR